MDFLKKSKITSESNFELLSNVQGIPNNNNNLNNNIDNLNLQNSFALLDDLNDSLNKKLSDSVIDLTKCFICLSPTIDPFSCPKCNNFACKKCLDAYFGGLHSKKCPICKQSIQYNELRDNKIMREIKEIINKDESKKNKIEQLSNLINEKKLLWENQGNDINNIIDKILKNQEKIKEYRKEYEIFFSRWKTIIDKTFEEYEIKIKTIIESLFNFGQDVKQSIIKYDEIDQKNKNNYYSNENIKSLINEIISMERKHFNEEQKNKTEKMMVTPLLINPNIFNFNIISTYIEKKNLDYSYLKKKCYNVHIGNCELNYIFDINNIFSSLSKFNFTLKKNRNATFFIFQRKLINNKLVEIIPMKLKNNHDRNYNYESKVDLDELKNESINKIEMDIKVQMFCIDY